MGRVGREGGGGGGGGNVRRKSRGRGGRYANKLRTVKHM